MTSLLQQTGPGRSDFQTPGSNFLIISELKIWSQSGRSILFFVNIFPSAQMVPALTRPITVS